MTYFIDFVVANGLQGMSVKIENRTAFGDEMDNNLVPCLTYTVLCAFITVLFFLSTFNRLYRKL